MVQGDHATTADNTTAVAFRTCIARARKYETRMRIDPAIAEGMRTATAERPKS